MIPPTLATFGPLDWAVMAVYLAGLTAAGVMIATRSRSTEEYFLGGRRIPVWAASLSVLATAISGATFVGAPAQSYVGDLRYLSSFIGMILAAWIVARFFIPAFYRENVTTVYELLGHRFGDGARLWASGMFLIGRLLASGAREYIAGLAGSMILFGDTTPRHVSISIAAMVGIGIVYTLVGGIRSVIWTDVVQAIVLVGAAVAAIAALLWAIPAPLSAVIHSLGPAKLSVIRISGSPTDAYTLVTALAGWSLVGIGAYGTDHDLAQRMLTCRSARKGGRSAINGVLLQIPVAAMFLVIGLLLYVFYNRPDLMGNYYAGPLHAETRDVFLSFILDHMPAGLRGLMMAGLFAAGLASFVSALNAMSSTTVCDFYRRFRPGRPDGAYLLAGQVGVVGWGLALGAFAIASVYWQASSGRTLIDFALMVMTFAYSGLVGVYLAALFTKRGTSGSAIAAMIAGFVTVAAMQFQPWTWWGSERVRLADPWQMTIATALAFAVCCTTRRKTPVSAAADSLSHSARQVA